jgi:hypothetical protein
VKIYDDLDEDRKKKLVSNLEFFQGPDEYKKFNKNLDSINTELKKSAEELKERVREYLLNN